MHSKHALILLFGVSALAFTGCEGMFTSDVINEINEQNAGQTTRPLHAYVQFDGLEGEASTAGYEGWSRVFSLEDGVTNVPNLFVGGGGGASGKAVFEPIRIVKQQDTASPALFQHLVQSMHIPAASIAVLRETQGGLFEYYRYDLESVFIAKYQLGEPDHQDGTPTVVIELAFAKITITYTPLEADGSPGSPVTASWDLLTHTK